MDRLDRISVAALVLLVLGIGALITRNPGDAVQDRSQLQTAQAAAAAPPPAELNGAAKVVRTLLEAGSLDKAEALISELGEKFPYRGEPHMLRGDLLMRKQEPVRAMHAYKEAIDLNPDYLDKKTPSFQGKKLKVAAAEALTDIERRLEASPGDESLRSEKKLVYYLYRKIAGSCG